MQALWLWAARPFLGLVFARALFKAIEGLGYHPDDWLAGLFMSQVTAGSSGIFGWLLTAIIAGAILWFVELRRKKASPQTGENLTRLYRKGQRIESDLGSASASENEVNAFRAWRTEVESYLLKHVPGEWFLFRTLLDRANIKRGANQSEVEFARKGISALLNKLALITQRQFGQIGAA